MAQSKSTSQAASSVPDTNETPAKIAVKLNGQTHAVEGAATGLEATKYYAFNETGNIMMSSTSNSTEVIQQSVRDVFNEVSVFFAAMTKAISTTINPATKEPYSIYDYNAIKRVIDSSGLFVQVTEEEIEYSSSSVGASFSVELLSAVLSLADGGATALKFAQSLMSSISKAATNGKVSVGGSGSNSSSSVGNITFVCEYLMGMPAVSAVVAYSDVSEVQKAVHVGPCFSGNSMKESITIYKDVYLFVTPTFIKQYSSDLDSVIDDEQYNQFVGYLQSLLKGMAYIVSVAPAKGGTLANMTLASGTTVYTISGANFGTDKGTISLGPINTDSSNAFTVKSWTDGSIQFTVPAKGVYAKDVAIYLYKPNVKEPEAFTAGQYSVGATS